MVRVCVVLAPGFEDVEALTPIDFLRRAGAEVVVASVGHDDVNIKSAHQVIVKCDVKFDSVANELFDGIVAPGGIPGAPNLAKDPKVVASFQRHFKEGKLVGAICASPGVLLSDACKIIKDKKACGYPGCDDPIEKNGALSMASW